MGWIEDLATERDHRSLRALALAMCASPAWPASDKRTAETVANKLRHADAGSDASWWLAGAGKPLLPALANVLDEDVPRIVELMQTGTATPDDGHHH